MIDISKKDRKALRRWAATAYDRELGLELTKLSAAIEAWRRGERTPHAVADEIHEYHDGVARDLFRFYTRADPASAVAQALVAGIVSEGELPADLITALEPLLTFHRWQETQRIPDEPEQE